MSSRSINNGLAAFLLSVLTPGLGQIFNGQLWKGVFSYGGLLGFLLVSTAIGLTHSFMGMTIYLILSLSAYMFVLGEAVFTAVQQARMDHRPLHTWRSYVAGLTLLLIAVFAVRLNIPEIVGVRAYKMTADSMLPTLASGDRIIADMTYYRSHMPRRGDLIVFRFPYQDHPFYVKRVIGVPGDRIKIVDQHVYLNGQQQNEPFAYYDSATDYDPLMPPKTLRSHHDGLTAICVASIVMEAKPALCDRNVKKMRSTVGSIKEVLEGSWVVTKPNTKKTAENPNVTVGMSDLLERTETRYDV